MTFKPVVTWTGDAETLRAQLSHVSRYIALAFREMDPDGWPVAVTRSAGEILRDLSYAMEQLADAAPSDQRTVTPFDEDACVESALALLRPCAEHFARGEPDDTWTPVEEERRGLGLLLDAVVKTLEAVLEDRDTISTADAVRAHVRGVIWRARRSGLSKETTAQALTDAQLEELADWDRRAALEATDAAES